MLKRIALSLTLATPLLLTACSGPMITHVDRNAPALQAFHGDAVGGKALLVTILGDPFGEGKDAVQEAVLADLPLDLHGVGDPKAYTTDPDRADEPHARLAIALGTDPNDGVVGICTAPMKTINLKSESALIIVMGLCRKSVYRGWEAVARAMVHTEVASSITSPAVKDALAQGMQTLTPLSRGLILCPGIAGDNC